MLLNFHAARGDQEKGNLIKKSIFVLSTISLLFMVSALFLPSAAEAVPCNKYCETECLGGGWCLAGGECNDACYQCIDYCWDSSTPDYWCGVLLCDF